MGKSFVLMAVALAFWSTQIFAQAASPGARGNPCKADIKQLCGDVKPGRGRLMQCLHLHESSASPACKDYLQEQRAKHRAEAKACKDDVAKLCSGVKAGGSRIIGCLRQHEADLSPGCKAEIPQK